MPIGKVAAIVGIIAGLIAVLTYFGITPNMKIAETRPCNTDDFYQEGWISNEIIQQSSGWVGGGSNPTNWCTQLKNQTISARGATIGAEYEIRVLNQSEQGRWAGTFKRDRQYNYHCQLSLSWNPNMVKKPDANCI